MRSLRPITWLLVTVVACTINLHLPAFQVVAWARMLVDYSRDNPLAVAVDMTFDGEHPCPMCTAIKAATTEQTGDGTTLQAATPTHPLFYTETGAGWIHTVIPVGRIDLPSAVATRAIARPLVPPPRSANA